jgi:hypothetical protein
MPGAFVTIAKDGTVTVQSNRLDMGPDLPSRWTRETFLATLAACT